MNWRLHLTNQAIRDLRILSGRSFLLAVWARGDRVEFYDVKRGAWHGYRQIGDPPNDSDYLSEAWARFLKNLVNPKGSAFLPLVWTRRAAIHSSHDGKFVLFHEPHDRLRLLADGRLHALDAIEAEGLVAVDMDGASGMVAALDVRGRLSVYRQGVLTGAFETGLQIDPLRTSSLVIAKGGRCFFLTDGSQIVLTDASGAAARRVHVHYRIRHIACSPAGDMVVTSDNEAGLIRVYHGADLGHSHQRFAQDLIAEAQQVQLMADLPPVSAGISALAAGSRGEIGFAMSGVICMTNVNRLAKLPSAAAAW